MNNIKNEQQRITIPVPLQTHWLWYLQIFKGHPIKTDFSIYFKNISDIGWFLICSFYLFFNILQIQTYEYQNVHISIKFCIQLASIKWISSVCNNRLLFITSCGSACSFEWFTTNILSLYFDWLYTNQAKFLN